MESYYSSDEEVAWGPVTLKEVRRELENTRIAVDHRRTDFGYCHSSQSDDMALRRFPLNQLDTSTSTSYYTPNATLQTNHSSNKEEFLEKVARLIDEETLEESNITHHSYTTASNNISLPDLDIKPDEVLDFVNLANESRDSIKIKCSSEDATSIPSRPFSDAKVNMNRPLRNGLSSTTNSSSRSVSTSFSSSRSASLDLPCCANQFNYSQNDSSPTVEQSSPDNLQSSNLGKQTFTSNGSPQSSPKSSIKSEPYYSPNIYFTHEIIEISSDSSFNESVESSIESGSNTEKHSKSLNKPSPKLSKNIEPQQISQLSKEYQENVKIENDESFKFNDTIEEMELALKQGLDYDMPYNHSFTNKTEKIVDIKEQPRIIQQAKLERKKRIDKTPQKKFDYVQSPIGDYIRKKSPRSREFKLPQKPAKSKTTPNRPPPALQLKNMKDIVSPVGLYIKNGPGGCLKQNVPVKTVQNLAKSPSTTCDSKGNKENAFMVPEKMYQPAKKTVTATKQEIKLPSSIKKMVQETFVEKREKRNQKDGEDLVRQRLLEEDITAVITDNSLLNQTENDVSFVIKKQAFIK